MNWLIPDPDETPTIQDIKKAIVERTLAEAPYIENVPVHKTESIIDVLARKAASDTLTDEEQETMLEVFRGAFRLDEE